MSILNAITAGAGGVALTGDTAGNLVLQSAGTTFATGNQYGIGLGTAVPSSGIGIAFPATQSASSDANTLDDYEEGTWTPVLDSETAGTGRATTINSANYTKIGNIVTVQCFISMATLGSGGSGVIVVNGLPFAVAGSSQYFSFGIGYCSNLNANLTAVGGYCNSGASNLKLCGNNTGNTVFGELTFSTYVKAGTAFIITATYKVA